jgi:hypothetical protein
MEISIRLLLRVFHVDFEIRIHFKFLLLTISFLSSKYALDQTKSKKVICLIKLFLFINYNLNKNRYKRIVPMDFLIL